MSTTIRLTILALGSRGDVQPLIALGLGLQQAGYAVKVAAAADYGDLVREHGLEFCSLVGYVTDLVDPVLVEQFLARANNPFHAAHHFMRQVNPIIDRLMVDCWNAAQDADGLIVTTLGMYCGLHLAEKRGIPWMVAHLHPYTPTSQAPHTFFPPCPRYMPLRFAYNRLTHTLANHGLWQLFRGPFNHPRRTVLGLEAMGPLALWRRVRADKPPILYGYSAAVAPPPADWPAHQQITGYWFLDHSDRWRPPAELTAFLAEGPPPVYIGFGSIMFGRDGERMTRMMVEALHQAGQRGILYRGWGELGRDKLPPNVLAVDSAPHDWLFPQVRGVVHHGGAGVTAAALRAGVPAVVAPFLGDQYFWAGRVAELGAGVAIASATPLSGALLAQAIVNVVNSDSMRQRAVEIGQHLKAEDGVKQAVEWIHRYLHISPTFSFKTSEALRHGSTTTG